MNQFTKPSVSIGTGVHKFSKNLEATSESYTPEGSDIKQIPYCGPQKYEAALHDISSNGLSPRTCEPLDKTLPSLLIFNCKTHYLETVYVPCLLKNGLSATQVTWNVYEK
jgi:hypothetical protein